VRVQVDCYAGYRGEETPRNIRLGGGTIEIREILDRWLGPDHRYFKVRGEDGGAYILRHDIESWTWDLVLYNIHHQGMMLAIDIAIFTISESASPPHGVRRKFSPCGAGRPL